MPKRDGAGKVTDDREREAATRRVSRCYLDMDGLLADLFDFISTKIHKKKYAQTSHSERECTRELWTARDTFSRRVGDVEEIFSELSPYPTNRDLLDIVCDRFGGFHICSHPARIDPEACIRGKMRWIEKHIVPTHGKYLLGTHFPDHKEQYARDGGTPNLLVDDYGPYVDAWKAAGGVAIRLRADRFQDGDGFREYFLGEIDRVESEAEAARRGR